MRWMIAVAVALGVLGQGVDEDGLDAGSYELRLEGELSGQEMGAARFAEDRKLDGDDAFVVQLLTPVLEGGVFLVFPGRGLPETGSYEPARVETKGMDGYKRIELEPGQVAVLYYEMDRNHMVLLGATGASGSVELTRSGKDEIRGRFDVEVDGATGNPSAFLRVRPRRGRIHGVFAAERGEVEFRKP